MNTVKPRTIDNLGMDSSVRYAKDQESVDVRLIEDSKLISRKIEIPVMRPYVPSEFEELFSYGRSTLWALFSAPPQYETIARTVFSHQLIPSLGSFEKQEAGIDKITALEDALNKPRKKRDRQPDRQKDPRDEKEEEEERKTLSTLLKCIEKLDQTLSFINARRNQYHRG